MSVGGIGAGISFSGPLFVKAPDDASADTFLEAAQMPWAGKPDPAIPAGPQASFSTRQPMMIDSASMIELQSGEETSGSKAADAFMAWMRKSPEERLRDQILKALNITEEDLEKMSPQDRAGIEQKIKDIIKEKLAPDGEAQKADTRTAEMLKLTS